MKRIILSIMILTLLPSPAAAKEKTIEFSGYEWEVRDSQGEKVGPGPNRFSSSSDSVWVDEDGDLHLKITRQNGKWTSAGIRLKKPLGYGTYRFRVNEVKFQHLDSNAVFGMFTYDDQSKDAEEAYHREIDIEVSKWGDRYGSNTQYVIQSPNVEKNKKQFHIEKADEETTHEFTWEPGRVFFRSFNGHISGPVKEEQIIHSFEVKGKDVPEPAKEQVSINLWLFKGEPPRQGKDIEIQIEEFEYKPLAKSVEKKAEETKEQKEEQNQKSWWQSIVDFFKNLF